jgi:hypothetical protein
MGSPAAAASPTKKYELPIKGRVLQGGYQINNNLASKIKLNYSNRAFLRIPQRITFNQVNTTNYNQLRKEKFI